MKSAFRQPAAIGSVLLVTIALAACAKREPPSGGPPDLTPPRVVEWSPDSGAAKVPLDTEISVSFSEGMEPRSTGDAVALAPSVDIQKRKWSGRTLTLVLAQALKAHQTYTLFVSGGARDRHGNAMGAGSQMVFSTADSFPRGRIEGEIHALGFSAPGTYLWCYDAASGRLPDSTAKDFDALGLADAEGHFRVDGLPVPGRYRLWAFADLNSNRSFEPSSDVLAPVDTTFDLTTGHPIATGVSVKVVNPRAPGRVRGTVLDSIPDSIGVVRVLALSEKDSTVRVLDDAEPSGEFDLQLDAGSWILRAFRDLDKSRSWQPEQERASDPLRMVVAPAADIVEIKIRLRPAPGGP